MAPKTATAVACAALLWVLVGAVATPAAGACYQVGMEIFDVDGNRPTDVARVRVDGRAVMEMPVRFSNTKSFLNKIVRVNGGESIKVSLELAHSYAFWTLRDRRSFFFSLSRGRQSSACASFWSSKRKSYSAPHACHRCMIAQKEPWCWHKGRTTVQTLLWYKVWVIRQQEDRC